MGKHVLVILPDVLHKRAKINAIERGVTLQSLVSSMVVDRMCEEYDGINLDDINTGDNDNGRNE